MPAQQGFQYEENAARFLKPLGVTPKSFTPAGARSDQPDILIKRTADSDSRAVGCELKITAASAGSLVLQWDAKTKKWKFNDIDKSDVEKIFLRDLAVSSGALARINKEWKDAPARFSPLYDAKESNKRKAYDKDLKRFRDVKDEIPGTNVEKYYNHKKTYYVNIGTHGFYLLGPSDPLKLNKDANPVVPRFSSSLKTIYRARVQYKGGGSYQFTFELQFGGIKASPYNIAPVQRGSVNIDKRAAELDCFM
jgi:hypothetical protein